jgi:hypothetical protein
MRETSRGTTRKTRNASKRNRKTITRVKPGGSEKAHSNMMITPQSFIPGNQAAFGKEE